MPYLGQMKNSSNPHILIIDGAWKKGTRAVGIGWMLQLTDGSNIHGGRKYGLAFLVLHAEAMACLRAL